jgi:hypothetical protein
VGQIAPHDENELPVTCRQVVELYVVQPEPH